ncbi:MAG: asparagine synthase (glutamine-hydrolyzing) [Microcystis flos-aquae DF17]|jgi:asparagine synthase (glutamine-hydrolysing)|uniref:asparagine synthase (glutamine-hydrolyzing) n=1 Tax=Microcystis aeruginosa Ma_QC_B_20070730_S2 TaxID=2486256 RepID=A0A552E9K7_MICAE|nr:asparagine synthase (glutamine-hydrolyzing) [Microcystis aeruginosa L211-11]NCR29675.1 asparagine synthase (glutamine-hydrolyzing) [Microcystis aeruginosa L211-101]REJ50173.1 MAG: asparagine synthase (glutamine-hydrolyzing) [Microcystis flos-aquae DF17]TRU31001.1 MAG: asparagine synthase (glutamine-hydrolyzing) [Microcystis aeruginosa Ma_QC_B_20070730_S2]
MCGICGYFDLKKEKSPDQKILEAMANKIIHRGPDSSGYFLDNYGGMGFRRLSLIDLQGGEQPLYNEDKSIVLVCNGEIFNYLELRDDLQKKGHKFRTHTDVEVLIHLYEEYGCDFLNKLNGQFAFALYDIKEQTLVLARDQMGICPLFYTIVEQNLIFGSEIKAILEHPLVVPEVDLTGLDQILTFPGLISPRTMFKNIQSLKSGHYLILKDCQIKIREYWDLDYPKIGESPVYRSEIYYTERLQELLKQSISYRLQADVPVGLYLSGGLDSSLIAAMVQEMRPDYQIDSFSIGFEDKNICESYYRDILLRQLNFRHHEIRFNEQSISESLGKAIYHAECPLKETYNTASLALSSCANRHNIKAILAGEGADELFAGYVGYRFEQAQQNQAFSTNSNYNLETILEEELSLKVWGDNQLFYERNLYAYQETKLALYSAKLREQFYQFDCLNFEVVDHEKIKNRHHLHKRSYLDFKLRLSDHLVADHGDRMALANSVEARYPFLDIHLVEFSTKIPPDLKLNKLEEKYILKQIAKNLIPLEIIHREKFAFHTQGSPNILKQNIEYIDYLLSSEVIKKQGYFDPVIIQKLKQKYQQNNFRLNLPFDLDLLIIPLSLGIFLEQFNL